MYEPQKSPLTLVRLIERRYMLPGSALAHALDVHWMQMSRLLSVPIRPMKRIDDHSTQFADIDEAKGVCWRPLAVAHTLEADVAEIDKARR